MHHLLEHAASPRISVTRSQSQILIPELAPCADYFDSLRGVRLNQERVSHSLQMLLQMWRGRPAREKVAVIGKSGAHVSRPLPDVGMAADVNLTFRPHPCRAVPNLCASQSTPAAPLPTASGSTAAAFACSKFFPRLPTPRRQS